MTLSAAQQMTFMSVKSTFVDIGIDLSDDLPDFGFERQITEPAPSTNKPLVCGFERQMSEPAPSSRNKPSACYPSLGALPRRTRKTHLAPIMSESVLPSMSIALDAQDSDSDTNTDEEFDVMSVFTSEDGDTASTVDSSEICMLCPGPGATQKHLTEKQWPEWRSKQDVLLHCQVSDLPTFAPWMLRAMNPMFSANMTRSLGSGQFRNAAGS
eukprot:gnl/TRDRNA2_/TRDRNA2_172889_c1_seq2.p1 gnl/TRDRNA2_/TRDRNA2_172889_c1~~gnl/TRDRNA2_/TRDRNA2_172889_c1_seq2.p1  ORF type:complete len:212 (+),score=22.73 gnl/TRDRNA2_/TRDRNA2_172889_c1_seq2:63-698(+)